MTTLSTVRTRVRKDLHDTDATAYRWTDAQLDRHIERALEEVSRAAPREQSAELATTAGSRDLSLASLTGLIDVEAVEYPAGRYPPARVGFSWWAATLALHTQPAPDGSDAKVHYTALHTLDDSGTTLPPHLVDLVAAGAGAYAATEYAAFAIDRLNTGGQAVAEQYAAWGRARLTAFGQLVRQHARARGLRPRRLYLPA
jgi:hypothetical protein